MKRKPRLYFCFRSPFSWMALRRLEELLPEAPELIDYYPYWEPDEPMMAALNARGAEFHYAQMSKAKHLYILADTKRLAKRFGYSMAWPVDIDPWWELPHLAWIKASHHGLEREFYRVVTEARWERAENICDPAVIHRLAASIGLDGDELVAAAEDPAIRAEGLDKLVAHYEDDVFGVPYFKLGRHRFWGVDRLEDFVAALNAARQEIRGVTP
ncbi:2-hydroxychromene-2-carboxylate isomerase [Thermomonospora echinospora]|uniref:2-hydroxychromene-2-carboxylate isomerase n=1 Tax=Thermomonospora echinospora TaxID=1992 RepID=A0A1H5VHK4_9ACTN|nr:DsbA family protein [Thermomonospora echinospora]SEF86281.1 2-hydroxychromene-2-carboxylate isomerase [Thermomonospora echinospora]